MQGSLGPGALIALFRVLFAEQKSGVLEIASGPATRKLLFQKGIIKFASTNVPQERLGDYLLRIGKLRAADLEKATKQVGRGERLGQILVRLGMLSQDDLQRHARDHVLQIIYACFGVTEGQYRYEEVEVPLGQEIKAGLSMAALIIEGVRRMEPVAAAAALGSGDQVLRPTTDARLRSQPIALRPQEGFLMSRVDGRATVDEVVAVSPLPAEETMRTLLGLWCAGLIEDPRDPTRLPFDISAPASPAPPAAPAARPAAPSQRAQPQPSARASAPKPARAPAAKPAPRPAPSASREIARRAAAPAAAPAAADREAERAREVMERFAAIQGQSLYDLLGVSTSADESEVRRAYYALAKRLHPDRFQGAQHDEVRHQAERLFSMLTEAYNVLSDAETRQRYDQESATPEPQSAANRQQEQSSMARQNFLHGKALLEQGQMHNAITFFENACQQDGSKAEYFHYLATVQLKNPKWRQEAEGNFKRALEIDPSLVAAYVGLGQVYRKMNRHEQAERMFREALRWDPEHPVAQKELAGGGEPKAGAGIGSVFKGMFKK